MEIVYSSASHHAMLFAYIAKEVIDTFGQEGEYAIRKAVGSYGWQRGRRMAMRARLDGKSQDARSYALYTEWECFPGQVERDSERRDGCYCIHYHRCPWYTEWKHFGMLDYGKYYCADVDNAILSAFGIRNGGLKGSRVDGCATCDLVFGDTEGSAETDEHLAADAYYLGDSARQPWEYHVGHLYQALSTGVVALFGREGRRALKRALKKYESHFGSQAKDLVLQYAELDFDVLPPYQAPLKNLDPDKRIHRLLETDVLVAGGSGAGVTAAVEAAKKGLRVTLLCKGRIGRSGNLIMAGGGFGVDAYSAKHDLKVPEARGHFTRKDMLDCLVKEGFYLSDQDLAEQYAEDGPEAVRQLLEWGEKCGQKYAFLPGSTTWVGSGRCFARAVAQGIAEHPEIRTLEDCVILDVLTDRGQVSGALALDIYKGELLLIRAKAVILATGGYQPFEVNNTSSDMTGDGQAIAFRAGAELVDMEFVLGMHTALEPAEMKGSIYPFVFEFNIPELKCRYLDRNLKPVEIPAELADRFRGKKISKLVSSWFFAQAKAKGLLTDRNGLYLDYSQNTREEKREALDRFYARFMAWHSYGYYNGESLSAVTDAIMNDRPLEVTIGYEYSMGGVQVDENMATCVTGLYAAGEVTGGTFGACRAGDGIVEMLVQGTRAGRSAAAFCRKRELRPVNDVAVSDCIRRHTRYFDRRGGISAYLLLDRIRHTCTEGFGILRSEQGLRETLNTLVQLRAQLDNMCRVMSKSRVYNMEWLKAIQCDNLLTCCRAGVMAALERKESRGCHMRSDYPAVDHDHYLVKYVFRAEQGNMVMSVRKPRVRSYSLPEGTAPSVVAYLTDPELDYRR